LADRIPDEKTLCREIVAWETARNDSPEEYFFSHKCMGEM